MVSIAEIIQNPKHRKRIKREAIELLEAAKSMKGQTFPFNTFIEFYSKKDGVTDRPVIVYHNQVRDQITGKTIITA